MTFEVTLGEGFAEVGIAESGGHETSGLGGEMGLDEGGVDATEGLESETQGIGLGGPGPLKERGDGGAVGRGDGIRGFDGETGVAEELLAEMDGEGVGRGVGGGREGGGRIGDGIQEADGEGQGFVWERSAGRDGGVGRAGRKGRGGRGRRKLGESEVREGLGINSELAGELTQEGGIDGGEGEGQGTRAERFGGEGEEAEAGLEEELLEFGGAELIPVLEPGGRESGYTDRVESGTLSARGEPLGEGREELAERWAGELIETGGGEAGGGAALECLEADLGREAVEIRNGEEDVAGNIGGRAAESGRLESGCGTGQVGIGSGGGVGRGEDLEEIKAREELAPEFEGVGEALVELRGVVEGKADDLDPTEARIAGFAAEKVEGIGEGAGERALGVAVGDGAEQEGATGGVPDEEESWSGGRAGKPGSGGESVEPVLDSTEGAAGAQGFGGAKDEAIEGSGLKRDEVGFAPLRPRLDPGRGRAGGELRGGGDRQARAAQNEEGGEEGGQPAGRASGEGEGQGEVHGSGGTGSG